MFPTIKEVVVGETGIDIFPRVKDKSQIINDFGKNDVMHFYGDRMDKAGNDYPLKKVILDKKQGHCFYVKDYKETWKLLKQL